MTKTNFAEATRLIDERLRPGVQVGWVRTAMRMCMSGQLRAGGRDIVMVRNCEASVDEDPYVPIDFQQFWLPPSRLLTATRLSDRDDLCIATTLAVDVYLTRTGPGKSTHVSADQVANTLSKFWEWGFLNDVYRPEDWTPAHLRALWSELRRGGWPLALRIEERTRELITAGISPENLLDKYHLRSGRQSLQQREFRALVQTNLADRGLSRARSVLLQSIGRTEDLPPYPIYSQSVFGTTARHLQYLARVPTPYGIGFDPELAIGGSGRAGAPVGRTRNLDVDVAAKLLDASAKWIYEFAPAILKWVRASNAAALAPKSNRAESRAAFFGLLESLPEKAELEELIGLNIYFRREGGKNKTMYMHVVGMLMTACFMIIALMNARRRDEICHKKLGVKKGAMRVEDKALGVYNAEFYIEKTLKSYAPFFVNRITYDAFKVLQDLNDVQTQAELQAGIEVTDALQASLFWLRPFAWREGIQNQRMWYRFDAQNTAGRRFLQWALGTGGDDLKLPSHVFRRLYGLLFVHRFEHGTLQALSYQLKHFSLEMTQRYVTDATITETRERIPVSLRMEHSAVRDAVLREQAALDKAISDAADEKMGELIDHVLNRSALYAGGFPRLVHRLHKKLSRQVEYSRLDAQRQAKRLKQVFTKKGHSLKALGHGDCLAGGGAKPRTARCHDPQSQRVDRSTAGAVTCAQCPYHAVSMGYLNAQRLDLAALLEELEQTTAGSVKATSLATQIRSLEVTIDLHRARIERNEP